MKKRIFSGIQPSGNLHLGNYLGAIKNWVSLQNDYDSIFCIVDLHAITVPQDPQELSQKTLEVTKLYLASGISARGGFTSGGDPKFPIIFVQSAVKEHTELMWILNSIANNSDLTKMTQFKQKSGVDFDEIERYFSENTFAENINKNMSDQEVWKIISKLALAKFKEFKKKFNSVGTGIYNYPILMVADILLYDTNLVPVGEDQLQHLELTRKLGRKFNQKFGETFVIPEGFTKKESQRIMGLDDPTKKMSKSASSEYNWIGILDSPEIITRKIMKAVTDSAQGIEYSDEKPALKNLINIFSLITDQKPQEIVEKYQNQGYKKFKEDLAESLVNYLKPIQEKYYKLDDKEVKNILKSGADQARELAQNKLIEVKKKMGLGI